MKAAQPVGIISIYDGQTCLGHMLNRGRMGFEAFDTDDKSLGTFKSQAEAVRAVVKPQIAGRPGG